MMVMLGNWLVVMMTQESIEETTRYVVIEEGNTHKKRRGKLFQGQELVITSMSEKKKEKQLPHIEHTHRHTAAAICVCTNWGHDTWTFVAVPQKTAKAKSAVAHDHLVPNEPEQKPRKHGELHTRGLSDVVTY